ncbi:hypothetical protein N7523_010219 [Penicillium sp. IBT 18751x]|nr:hypothetical protein N7523_010219 [Penicillium sp. IBT 18751x]
MTSDEGLAYGTSQEGNNGLYIRSSTDTNVLSQRLFTNHRHRKEQYVRDLEAEIVRLQELRGKLTDADAGNQQESGMLLTAQRENQRLKEILDAHKIMYGPSLAQREPPCNSVVEHQPNLAAVTTSAVQMAEVRIEEPVCTLPPIKNLIAKVAPLFGNEIDCAKSKQSAEELQRSLKFAGSYTAVSEHNIPSLTRVQLPPVGLGYAKPRENPRCVDNARLDIPKARC